MVGALGDDDRRASALEGSHHVVEDHVVAGFVLGQKGVEPLKGRALIRNIPSGAEGGMPKHDMVGEGPNRRLPPGIDPMPHRSALHEDNGVMTILARHRGR